MGHCININHSDFLNLLEEVGGNSTILAAKVSLWQELNGIDSWPTADNINNLGSEQAILDHARKNNIPINDEDIKTEIANIVPEKVTPTSNILSFGQVDELKNNLPITSDNINVFNQLYFNNYPVYKYQDNEIIIDTEQLNAYNQHSSKIGSNIEDEALYNIDDSTTITDPTISKLVNIINNRMAMLTATITKNLPKEVKNNLWNRINELKEDKLNLEEVQGLESIVAVSFRELDYVAKLLDSGNISAPELLLAGNFVDLWSFRFSSSLMTEEQLDDVNGSYFKTLQEIGLKADALHTKYLKVLVEFAQNQVKKSLGVEISKEEVTTLHETSNIVAATLDTSMARDYLVLAIDDIIKRAENNSISIKRELQTTITNMFKELKADKKAMSKVGKNYDLFWQTYDIDTLKQEIQDIDIKIRHLTTPGTPDYMAAKRMYGNKYEEAVQGEILKLKQDKAEALRKIETRYTGGMTNLYSIKWQEEENKFANSIKNLDKPVQTENGEEYLTPKEKQNARWELIRKRRDKQVWIDLRFLNVTDATQPIDYDNYPYKNFKEYRDSLIKEFGEEQTDEYIALAKHRYQDYLLDKDQMMDQIDMDDTISNKAKAKADWIAQNDPIAMLNYVNGDLTIKDLRVYPEGKYIKKFPRKYIKGTTKETGYYDKRFETIKSDKTLYEFQLKYSSMMRDAISMLPQVVANDLPYNFLANVHKSLIEQLANTKTGEKLAILQDEVLNALTSKEVLELNASQQRRYAIRKLSGELEKAIPIHHTSKLDINDRTMDLEKMISLFVSSAVNYDYKNQVKDKVELLYEALQNAETLEINPRTNTPTKVGTETVKIRKGAETTINWARFSIDAIIYGDRVNKGKPSDKKLFESEKIFGFKTSLGQYKDHDELKAKIEEFMDVKLKDTLKRSELAREVERMRDELDRQLDAGEIEPVLYDQKMAYLEDKYKALGGRALVYQNLGELMMKLTQLKGMGFNLPAGIANVAFGMVSNLVHASGNVEYNGSHLLKAMGIMFRSFSQNPSSNKVYNIIKNLDILFEVIDTRYKEGKSENRLAPLRHIDPYIFQNKTEYFIQGTSAIALMLKQTVDTPNGKISVFDLFNNNGEIDVSKLGEDQIANWNDKLGAEDKNNYSKLRAKIVQVNKYLHGNYDPSSPLLAKKSLIGRMLFQFRSWIPMGVVGRFMSLRYDPQLEREIKGRWVTYRDIGATKSLAILFKQLIRSRNAFDNLSDVDKENMRKNLTELIMAANLSVLMMLLRLSIDDDDDEKGFYDYSAMMLANQVYRAQQDIFFYINPMTAYQVIKDPVPITKSVTDLIYAIHGTARYYTDDNYMGQPPYVKWSKAFPFTNQIPKINYLANQAVNKNDIIDNIFDDSSE